MPTSNFFTDAILDLILPTSDETDWTDARPSRWVIRASWQRSSTSEALPYTVRLASRALIRTWPHAQSGPLHMQRSETSLLQADFRSKRDDSHRSYDQLTIGFRENTPSWRSIGWPERLWSFITTKTSTSDLPPVRPRAIDPKIPAHCTNSWQLGLWSQTCSIRRCMSTKEGAGDPSISASWCWNRGWENDILDRTRVRLDVGARLFKNWMSFKSWSS